METLILFGAQYLFAVILLGSAAPLVWLSISDRKRYVVSGLLTLALVVLLKTIASSLYVDPRPFTQGVHALFPHAADNGFPSEHALFSFTLAFLSFSVSRPVAYLLLPLAMIVGACRVLAGVHHTVDILAGAFLAVAAVGAGVGLARVRPFVKLWGPRKE